MFLIPLISVLFLNGSDVGGGVRAQFRAVVKTVLCSGTNDIPQTEAFHVIVI